MIPASKQAGAALLSILLIVATLSVAALMATSAIARQTELQKLGSRRTSSNWAARSAEAAVLSSAADLVGASGLPATGDGAARVQTMALPLDGGQVVVTVRELGPCFNLNALATEDEAIRVRTVSAFSVLLEDIGVPDAEAASLTDTLIDWMDADAVQRPLGAEDSTFLMRMDGFRAANQPLKGAGELAALPGFTPELRAALAGHTCILPETEPMRLNVNALTFDSAAILRAATLGALSPAEARRFVEARPAAGWRSVQDVNDDLSSRPAVQQAMAGIPISVQGAYFEAEGDIQLDAGSWPFRFLLSAEGGKTPKVVWRSFGGAG